jgi:hypothetical protein
MEDAQKKKQEQALADLAKFGVHVDVLVEADIIQFLTKVSGMAQLKFRLGSLSVKPSDFKKVAEAFKKGDIRAVYDPKVTTGPKTAQYAVTGNILYLTFKNLTDLYNQGALIHEATHIIHDMRKLKGAAAIDNEEMGWITQMMYYRLAGYKGNTFPGASGPGGDVFKAAFAAADWYMNNSGKTNATLIEELGKKLVLLPEYKTIGNTTIPFDGFGGSRATPRQKPAAPKSKSPSPSQPANHKLPAHGIRSFFRGLLQRLAGASGESAVSAEAPSLIQAPRRARPAIAFVNSRTRTSMEERLGQQRRQDQRSRDQRAQVEKMWTPDYRQIRDQQFRDRQARHHRDLLARIKKSRDQGRIGRPVG